MVVQNNLRYSFISSTEGGFGLVEPNGLNSSLVNPFDFSGAAALHSRTELGSYFRVEECVYTQAQT